MHKYLWYTHTFRGEFIQARGDYRVLFHIAYGLTAELVGEHEDEIGDVRFSD